MDPIIFLKPPKIDPAVWRPEVPLVVLERCETKEQLCTWIGLRWLMAAFPREKGFGTRKIAKRAKVNQKYVTRYCQELIALELIIDAGEENIANFAHGRNVYSIPLHELDRISNDIALNVLKSWGAATQTAHQSDDQLTLDLGQQRAIDFSRPDPPRDQTPDPPRDQTLDPPRDQTLDPPRDQTPDPPRDQTPDPPRDQTPDPPRDHWDGWMDHGGREGSRAPAKQKKRGRPPLPKSPPLTIPDSPTYEPALPAHPLRLWQDACPTARPIDAQQLASLAAEHDSATERHGWYWVGRAILAASLTEDVRQVGKVRAVLTRWRDTASYGSDSPRKGAVNGRSDTKGRAGRPEHDSRRDGTGARPRAIDGQPDTPGAALPERGPVRTTLEY